MKNTKLLTLILSILLPLTSFASNSKEFVTQLEKFSLADLKVSESRTEKDVDTKVQEILKVLEAAVDKALSEKTTPSPDLIQQLVRVAGITFNADPSMAAAEIIQPLYQKNKKAFEKALKSLSKKDRKEMEESLKNSAREDDEGNG